MAWATEAGAEYPEGLCDLMAEAYVKFQGDPPACAQVQIDELGTVEPHEEMSRKRRRHHENRAAIGGMRSPHSSLKQVPGWKRTGQKLRCTH